MDRTVPLALHGSANDSRHHTDAQPLERSVHHQPNAASLCVVSFSESDTTPICTIVPLSSMLAAEHPSLHMFDGRTLVYPGVEDTIWLCDTRQFVTYTGTLAFLYS